jgi:MYXO-CTERM domain-containing protein
VVLLLLALAATNSWVASSWADGDPASDVLPVKDVFFPYEPNVSPALEAATEKTVHAAGATGFQLKVAIIGTALELGLVQNLWGQPQAYAQFLDREISFNEPRKLLVVMPAGFGVVPASLAGALASMRVDTRHRSDGLTRSALLAVVALARSQGHPIATPSLSPSSSSSSPPAVLVFGLPVALLALAGLGVVRRSRSRPPEHPPDPDDA